MEGFNWGHVITKISSFFLGPLIDVVDEICSFLIYVLFWLTGPKGGHYLQCTKLLL